MVDYSDLRKKFPNKDPKKRRRAAAIKAIAREYERKKAELGGLQAPVMKKGIVFYVVVIIGLLMLGGLVLSVAGKGGRERISRAQIDVRKSIDALAVALGRYRYHVGEYPSTEEGLDQLASTKVIRSGWNGPYIRKVVNDPWGHPYVYARNGATENPTLYSKGPDGVAGSTDDILPDPRLFDEAFRDTSWTQGWMPYQLRGYVLAPDEKTKKLIETQVKSITAAEQAAAAAGPVEIPRRPPPREEYDADGNFVLGEDPWGERPSDVRIASHWNHDGHEGEKVRVVCATAGDEVELYLNGESQGRRGGASGSLLAWEVPYEAGELKAIAFRDGHPIGEDAVKTSDKAYSVRLKSDVVSVADGDMAFVRVDVVDEYGAPVPTAEGEVELAVEGPGEIVSAVEGAEGDPARLVLARGRAVGAVKRGRVSGLPLKLTASLKGVRSATLAIPRK